MKLMSLLRDGRSAIGVLAGDETVVDLSVAAPDLPRGMCRFLAAGDESDGGGPRAPSTPAPAACRSPIRRCWRRCRGRASSSPSA